MSSIVILNSDGFQSGLSSKASEDDKQLLLTESPNSSNGKQKLTSTHGPSDRTDNLQREGAGKHSFLFVTTVMKHSVPQKSGCKCPLIPRQLDFSWPQLIREVTRKETERGVILDSWEP